MKEVCDELQQWLRFPESGVVLKPRLSPPNMNVVATPVPFKLWSTWLSNLPELTPAAYDASSMKVRPGMFVLTLFFLCSSFHNISLLSC